MNFNSGGKVDVGLYLEGTYPWNVGGVATVVDLLVRSLPQVNFGLYCIMPVQLRHQAPHFKLPENILSMTTVAVSPIPRSGKSLRNFITTLMRASFPQAAVHHSHTCGLAGLAASFAKARQPGSRMLLTEHSLFVRDAVQSLEAGGGYIHANEIPAFECHQGQSVSRLSRLLMRMGRHVYRSSDMVSYLDDTLFREAGKWGRCDRPSEIIPNPSDWDRMAGARRMKRPKGAVRILWMGRIVPQKGTETAIRCAEQLRALGFPFRMSIAGPEVEAPCYANHCRELVNALALADQVTFDGCRDAVQALADTDVLLLTSESEAMPMVVLEALAAGVPVCSLDVGLVRQMTGDAGRIVSLERIRGGHQVAGALAAEVIRLTSDHGVYQRASVAALVKAREHSLTGWSARWLAAYKLPRLEQDGSSSAFTNIASTTSCLPPAM